MIHYHRVHEEPSATDLPDSYQKDLWRLGQAQAFLVLDQKPCFPSANPGRISPSLLRLITTATTLIRGLAVRLPLDAGLAEGLLISQVMGHPAGGETSARHLNHLLHKHGGFNSENQALRIVDELEMIFPEFNGLNLSWEIRRRLGASPPAQLRGVAAESSPERREHTATRLAARLALLQLRLWNVPAELRPPALAPCALWANIQAAISATYPRLESRRLFSFTLHQFLLRLVDEASLRSSEPAIHLTPHSERAVHELEMSLDTVFTKAWLDSAAVDELKSVLSHSFHGLVAHPQLIPEKFAVRIKKDGLHRVAVDCLVSLGDAQLRALGEQFRPATQVSDREQLKLL